MSQQIQEYNGVKERLSEQGEMITDLENRLKERNDTLQHDKHKYVTEIKHLRSEVGGRDWNWDKRAQRPTTRYSKLKSYFQCVSKRLSEHNDY